MKKLFPFLLLVFMLIFGCSEKKKSSPSSLEFQRISEEFINGYLDWRPLEGVKLGFHQYDGKITDLSQKSIEAEITRLKKYDKILSAIDSTSLSTSMFYDLNILRYAIKWEIVNIEELSPFNENPMIYAMNIDISPYILHDFAPIADRLKSIITIEKQTAANFETARLNLKDSLAKPLLETAIQIVKGNADFLANDVLLVVKEVKNDSLLHAFKAVNDQTINELNLFAEYLENEKLPKANNNFAIGNEKYKRMLEAEGTQFSPEKILEIGLEELEKEKAAFNATARIINPHQSAMEVLQVLMNDRPTSENLISEVNKNLASIKQFIAERKIVDVPLKVQLTVKETPQYARSIGTASMQPPGPYETKESEGYFFVTPVEQNWSKKQKDDWLSMFEKYSSSLLAIHEVYPGHYTQFLLLQSSPATRIEKIFRSYSFIEGWAHYTEKMMIDEGFGNSGDPAEAAKFKLAQSVKALLRLCRLCVSIKMHCQGMSVEEATKFLMENCPLGEKPSKQEALRGTFDPGYLFYTLGKLQLLKLREDYRQQEGANFSLQKFHEQILEHGTPPIILLRKSLLKDKDSWDKIM